MVSAGNSSRQSILVATSSAYKLPASDGLLFNDPRNGNCQACHPSARGAEGSFPMFTDFSFDKLGVPSNAAIVRNDEPGYFDLGLCARADLAARAGLCDAFKVPTLRNVAQRHVFFHNGRSNNLKDVVMFVMRRRCVTPRSIT